MSAYIVDKELIVYLVQAAQDPDIRGIGNHGFRWCSGRAENRRSQEMAAGDYDKAAEVGKMLWQENIKSVATRYRGDAPDELPGAYLDGYELSAADFTPFYPKIDVVQLFKACDCFEYQACEHGDGWRDSEARDFIDALRGMAWRRLPGYGEAEWGAPASAYKVTAA